jgi:hypothetical protein
MATTATPTHRVSVAVAHARADIGSLVDVPVWSMTDREAADALVELTRHEAEVAELKARIARHADEQQVGQDHGASSTAVWLANQTRITRPAAHSTVWLGQQLHHRPATRRALAAGGICVDQARVILRWVDTIPEEHQVKAEAHLLHLAREHDAKDLNRLGKRLWEVIDPDGVDAREAEILEREEARAQRTQFLKMWEDGHGSLCGEFKMPVAIAGASFKKLLAATMAAKHQNAVKGAGTGPEQLGQAFVDLITRIPAKAIPKSSGLNATVVVTISEDSLLGRLEEAGVLETGERISPSLARRLACEAGILPAVLGGKSEVLDLGRTRRLFTKAQRLALSIQQKGQCATTGCDRTTGLHAHHLTSWADHGETDLTNAIGLCHWHHMKAHDTTFDMTRHADRSVSFHRRQ